MDAGGTDAGGVNVSCVGVSWKGYTCRKETMDDTRRIGVNFWDAYHHSSSR